MSALFVDEQNNTTQSLECSVLTRPHGQHHYIALAHRKDSQLRASGSFLSSAHPTYSLFLCLLGSQCKNDNDFVKYEWILCKWINYYLFKHPSPAVLYQCLYLLPRAKGYIKMAEVGQFGDVPSIVKERDISYFRLHNHYEEAGLDSWLRRIHTEVCQIDLGQVFPIPKLTLSESAVLSS